ncbi:helix-turn-helix transcriptional regulator [Candidatus Formimonas warabiya]|uniref:HTH cro/C1-type domain-containing protein n=1 Tax=Formimonas warabiya TaxID=1761012 RepID=A0A3G1KPQ7_FORW1|nr:helix-turn-helix transcriptional regulator [Candidatus Formimonas warabiya]ATW24125.1 hypothetical protein DCMF_04425 [Candidatus Formimonas warabiya]
MKNLVRKYRRELEMTQEELAGRASTSRQTIIDIEKGRIKNPSYKLVSNISIVLGKEVHEIFFAEDVAPVEQFKTDSSTTGNPRIA